MLSLPSQPAAKSSGADIRGTGAARAVVARPRETAPTTVRNDIPPKASFSVRIVERADDVWDGVCVGV